MESGECEVGVRNGQSGFELASSDMDFAHAGCELVRRTCIWTSPHQRSSANNKRSVVFLAARSCNWRNDAKRGCCGAFRRPPAKRGSCGLDSRAEIRALHGVFPRDALGIWLVCKKTRFWEIRLCGSAFCLGIAI